MEITGIMFKLLNKIEQQYSGSILSQIYSKIESDLLDENMNTVADTQNVTLTNYELKSVVAALF